MIVLIIPAAWLLFFGFVACEGEYHNTLRKRWKAAGFVCLAAMTVMIKTAFR